MAVQPIPEGYHMVTPYLIVTGAADVMEFTKRAFGATERFRMNNEEGKVGHGELQIGDSVVMIAEASQQYPPMPGTLHLYVEDCDATYRRALEAGATSIQEVADQFYGDRSGGVRDASGNQWWISTHVEDVDPDEIARRAEAAHAAG